MMTLLDRCISRQPRTYRLPRKSPAFRGMGCLLCLLLATACSRHVTIYSNPDTGLLTWTAEKNGFSLELIQLVPDYVRAIYGSHDFPTEEIEDIAAYCVFGTIIKNTSGRQLNYRVAEWRYRDSDSVLHPVKTKTQWLNQWRKAGITFSWTLLPDEGTFNVGDWQQGFTTIKVPRDSTFDLIYTWKLGDNRYVETIKQLRCAPQTN